MRQLCAHYRAFQSASQPPAARPYPPTPHSTHTFTHTHSHACTHTQEHSCTHHLGIENMEGKTNWGKQTITGGLFQSTLQLCWGRERERDGERERWMDGSVGGSVWGRWWWGTEEIIAECKNNSGSLFCLSHILLR